MPCRLPVCGTVCTDSADIASIDLHTTSAKASNCDYVLSDLS